MKKLITLLRANLIFQGALAAWLFLWPFVIRDWSLLTGQKAWAVFVFTAMLGLIWLGVYVAGAVQLYRLKQGSALLYAILFGLVVTSLLQSERSSGLPGVGLMFCASYGFVIALVFFSALRRLLQPAPTPESASSQRWVLGGIVAVFTFAFLVGVLNHLPGGKKQDKREGWRKLEEHQQSTKIHNSSAP